MYDSERLLFRNCLLLFPKAIMFKIYLWKREGLIRVGCIPANGARILLYSAICAISCDSKSPKGGRAKQFYTTRKCNFWIAHQKMAHFAFFFKIVCTTVRGKPNLYF